MWTLTRHSDYIEDVWGTGFYVGDPDLIMSCLTCSKLAMTVQRTQLGMSLVDSLAWQAHLPDATADDTSLFPSSVPMR